MGVAYLYKSMGAASLHKSMGAASVHKSMGATFLHKSPCPVQVTGNFVRVQVQGYKARRSAH